MNSSGVLSAARPDHDVAGMKVLVKKPRFVQPGRHDGHGLGQLVADLRTDAARAVPARWRSTNSSSGIAEEMPSVTR